MQRDKERKRSALCWLQPGALGDESKGAGVTTANLSITVDVTESDTWSYPAQ